MMLFIISQITEIPESLVTVTDDVIRNFLRARNVVGIKLYRSITA